MLTSVLWRRVQAYCIVYQQVLQTSRYCCVPSSANCECTCTAADEDNKCLRHVCKSVRQVLTDELEKEEKQKKVCRN